MPRMKSLTRSELRRLAGSRAYARGESYFQEGRVTRLNERDGRLTATVAGTRKYRVSLSTAADYDCTCPMGLQGDFCKHCVAAALAWREERSRAGASGRGAKRAKTEASLTKKEVRGWLLLQTKETLADRILAAADEDERLENRLMLEAAAASGVNLATYRKVLDQAIGAGEFVEYYDMYDYWRNIDQAVDAVEQLVDGHPAAVIELSEYALAGVERAIEHVDDSDGHMGMLLERLQDLHLTACRKAKPEPEALAERLFRWALHGEWDTFLGAAGTYAAVLGKRGMQRYRELAEVEWAKVKPLEPGDHRGAYGRRFRITHIMQHLAEQSRDLEAQLAIKRRDLSHSYAWLQIAELYKKARREDHALEWAEQGLKAFADSPDIRLQDFLADIYHRRKRHDEAMRLIWSQFEPHPSLEGYRKLKKHAARSKSWPEWRDKALDRVRLLIDKEAPAGGPARSRYRNWQGRSLLVEIFLWEKDTEAAWQEAQRGGCTDRLWFTLASLRENSHSRDAIAVYQRLIGPIVKRTNNDAYAEAAKLLRRIKRLQQKLGEQAEFREYLAQVRTEHKPKRNFIKLVDKIC